MKQKLLWTLLFCIPFLVIGSLFFLGNISHVPTVKFTPQKPQVFALSDGTNAPLNILATTLPQFVLSLKDGKFNNLWQADAAGKNNVDSTLTNDKQDTAIVVDSSFNTTKKEVVFTPQTTDQFKPGLYHLNVTIKTVAGKDITITQDFRWGVLAINTGKAIYQSGDTVKIGMGVLDDLGHTKCIATGDVVYNTAKIWLTIVSPSGKEQILSTDDGTIVGSKECAPISVTNNPDFQATYNPQEIGKYTMHMTAENSNGERSIDDYFMVSNTPPAFDIARTSYPTRIYPLGHYPVALEVVANQNYSGPVSDVVPSSFTIANISDNGSISSQGDYQQITWQVNWQKGQTYTLEYNIKFPPVSPEFYLVGPLIIGSFSEGREWQIASDAVSMVQNVTPTTISSGTSVSLNWSPHPIVGDIEIVICSETSNQSISKPTQEARGPVPRPNAWTSGFTITSGTLRMSLYYRTATVNDSSTVTCAYGGSTGVKAIQLYEYSGLSSSSTKDTSKTHTAASCSGTPTTFTSNTGSFTPGNPVVLVIASFTATNQRTVTGVTSGFTIENTFTGASAGTFSTHDQVTASITDYTDTITYTTTGGTCVGGIISFNSPISISQNGYRFFQNQNNLTPGSGIDVANTPVPLNPHQPFRLRVLLDVDGTQSIAVGGADFILEYATLSAGLTCDTASYDVVSTPGNNSDIAYNPQGLGSGTNISADTGQDPTDSGYTTRLESYYEDDFTSNGPSDNSAPGDISNDQLSIAGNQAGLWDFSLIDNTDDTQSNTYCLKVTNGDGSDLSAYVQYPQVTTFYNEVNIKGGTTIKGPGSTTGKTIIQ